LANTYIFEHWLFLVKVEVMLRPTVSGPVCLGIEHPLGAQEQIFISQTVSGLLMWGALLDERTGLSFTTAAGLASAVILGSESSGTPDRILLSIPRVYIPQEKFFW
jgi:hypothetical protein